MNSLQLLDMWAFGYQSNENNQFAIIYSLILFSGKDEDKKLHCNYSDNETLVLP